MTSYKDIQFPAIFQENIGGTEIQTVNAREIHEFLQVGKVFAAWINERIEQYGFVENQDFIVISENGNNPQGGRPTKEYHVSIDMGKELSMVDRGERGKMFRKYFLECEKKAKEATASIDVRDPKQLSKIAIQLIEVNQELSEKVAELTPKAEALDRIATSDGSLCVTDAAKNLQVKPKTLFEYLRSHGWTYRRIGSAHDVAYQSKLTSGLLEHKITTVYRSDGTEKTVTQARVTPKGLAFLAKIFPPVAEVA